MDEERLRAIQERVAGPLFRHWQWVIVGAWLLYIAFIVSNRWTLIQAFALPDTDDNLRLAQVRALIGGQGWFDLVQHRFDPAHGTCRSRRSSC
jgi:hypothetical protein